MPLLVLDGYKFNLKTDHPRYIILFNHFTAVVSSTTYNINVLPDIELFVDAMRGVVPAHGTGVSFHIGSTPAAMYATGRMGNFVTGNYHICFS